MYWENQSNNDKEEFYNYYLLDGNSGKTTYLGLLHEGYLNINDNTIVTLADDEEEDRILDLDQISRFEFGK